MGQPPADHASDATGLRARVRSLVGGDGDGTAVRRGHNIAKKETHTVGADGEERELYVHRKGATRAFPAGHPEVPSAYRDVGQPVIIPGSMGAGSYVLRGGENSMDLTFGSTAHGAGRLMSRTQAKDEFWGATSSRTSRTSRRSTSRPSPGPRSPRKRRASTRTSTRSSASPTNWASATRSRGRSPSVTSKASRDRAATFPSRNDGSVPFDSAEGDDRHRLRSVYCSRYGLSSSPSSPSLS